MLPLDVCLHEFVKRLSFSHIAHPKPLMRDFIIFVYRMNYVILILRFNVSVNDHVGHS